MNENVMLWAAAGILVFCLAALWLAQPPCQPGEVRVRSTVGTVCVRHH